MRLQTKTLLFLLLKVSFMATAQPPPKHWEAVAVNEKTKELAVFSGGEFAGGKFFNTDSLWLFNGQWRLVDNNDVAGRWAHALTYHKDALYTYGGLSLNAENKETVRKDLCMYGTTWQQLAEGPMLQRPFLYSSNEKLVLAGQSNEVKTRFELWEFDGRKFRQTDTLHADVGNAGFHILPAVKGFALLYASDSAFVIKSMTAGVIETITGLPKLSKYGLAYSKKERGYFLFGGLDAQRNFVNTLWLIKDGRARKIEAIGAPSPRASCHLLPTENGLILYGGTASGGKLSNEMWRYEDGVWSLVQY
jgi:hypothetical protein